MSVTDIDSTIDILLLLKNNWSLTESGLVGSDIAFSTGWYNDSIQMPQITVTPLQNVKQVMETGYYPLYRFQDILNIDIWVRPNQNSNSSIGWSKHAEYAIREEVKRIIRSGSHLHEEPIDAFLYLGKWRRHDETNLRPPVFRSTLEVRDNYFRKSYDNV